MSRTKTFVQLLEKSVQQKHLYSEEKLLLIQKQLEILRKELKK